MKSWPRPFLICVSFGVMLICSSCAHAASWPSASSVGGGAGVQIKGGLADEKQLADISALGFSWVRFSVGWGGIERDKDRYDWQEVDALVMRVRKAGLKMVIPLLGGNAVYDGEIAAPPRNTDRVARRPLPPQAPESVNAFARFAAQAVLRYGTTDIVWEIWNEPDLGRFWPPRAQAASFAVLAEHTCKTMRSVAPKAVIVGPALGRVPDPRDGVTPAFLDTFLASGAAHCVDALSVHPYRHGAEEPEAVFGDYATLSGRMAMQRFYKPILNTEWGYTTLQVTAAQQADYALRTRLTDMLWAVPLSIWYEWRDSRDDAADPEGHFGLRKLRGEDKEALHAVKGLFPRIKDSTLERQVHTTDPHDMLVLLRQPDGALALVGWTLRKGEEDGRALASFSQEGVAHTTELTHRPQLLGQGHNLTEIGILE